MSNAISLRVPKTLYEEVKKMAEDDGISMNQWVMLAVAEKASREHIARELEAKMYKKMFDLLYERPLPRERW